jgi:hypothetical protein
MLLFKCKVLGIEDLPAREGFAAAVMVDAWSQTTQMLTMWAPSEVGDELRELDETGSAVLELRTKTRELYDRPAIDAKPVRALKFQVVRVHRTGDA